tara:strand:- start:881 stop:1264 length:384 start_codon:yes stop_codon:yes gene_type:complete
MESKTIIKTSNAPKAIGAYSQGAMYEKFIFTSGQIPIDKNNNEIVSSDFRDQVCQTLNNLKDLIESQGSSIDKILKLTVYLTNMSDFNILNEVFEDFFKENFPARSVVQVVKLPKNSQVEIEAICIR